MSRSADPYRAEPAEPAEPADRAAGADRRARFAPEFLRDESIVAMRFLVVTAAALTLLWLALTIRDVTIATFLAFVFASLLWPVVKALSRFMPQAVAALLCSTGAVLVVISVLWLVGMQLVAAVPAVATAVGGSVSATNKWLIHRGWVLPQDLIDGLAEQLGSRADQIVSGISGVAISSLNILTTLGTVLLISTFATLFVLMGTTRLTEGVLGAFPERHRAAAWTALRDATVTARWWLFASTVTGLVNGVLIGAGLYALGVPLAIPLGITTFLLGYVPMIGSTIAGALSVGISLFFGGVPLGIQVLVLVVVVIASESNLLMPLLMSRAMKFPPVVTLLLSTAGAAALGIIGLFLSVPVAGILYAAVKGWRRETSWNEFMADRVPLAEQDISHNGSSAHEKSS